jgi:hypothetical protein
VRPPTPTPTPTPRIEDRIITLLDQHTVVFVAPWPMGSFTAWEPGTFMVTSYGRQVPAYVEVTAVDMRRQFGGPWTKVIEGLTINP